MLAGNSDRAKVAVEPAVAPDVGVPDAVAPTLLDEELHAATSNVVAASAATRARFVPTRGLGPCLLSPVMWVLLCESRRCDIATVVVYFDLRFVYSRIHPPRRARHPNAPVSMPNTVGSQGAEANVAGLSRNCSKGREGRHDVEAHGSWRDDASCASRPTALPTALGSWPCLRSLGALDRTRSDATSARASTASSAPLR